MHDACESHGLALVPLVAPTTPQDRLQAIEGRHTKREVDNGRQKPAYSRDWQHMNTAGYRAVNELLRSWLARNEGLVEVQNVDRVL